MVMQIETPSDSLNMALAEDICETNDNIETAPHDGVVIVINDFDEFGNKWTYKIELTTADIATINRVKR